MNSFFISNFHLPRFFHLIPQGMQSKLHLQASHIVTSQEAWNTTHNFETLLHQGSQTHSQNIELENQNFLSVINQELQQKINTPEPEIQNRLNTLNSNRVREGKTPLNFSTTNQEIEKILNNPSLGNKEKKDQIEEVFAKIIERHYTEIGRLTNLIYKKFKHKKIKPKKEQIIRAIEV